MKTKPRLLRITTVPISLKLLLRGQLSFFKTQSFEVLAVSADGPEINSLEEEGIPHKKVLFTRQITPLQDLIALLQLIFIILKFRPQIVHTHTPKAGLIGMIASALCFVPVRLHTVAGLPLMEASGFKRRLLKLTESITYKFAHRIYPNSKGLEAFILQNFNVKKEKIKVLGAGSTNGIDTEYFSPAHTLVDRANSLRSELQLEKGAMVFCFIGRIVRDKGINELVAAFNSISHEINSYLLLVGPFEDELDPIAGETREIIQNNSRILPVGYQHDVRPYLLASDAFVFPSYREGFPNVVLQASALKIPSIVSDINGCNEIIKHNERGLIVPPKNVDALKDAMYLMAKETERRTAYAENAYRYVVSNFSHREMLRLLHNEYLSLLK